MQKRNLDELLQAYKENLHFTALSVDLEEKNLNLWVNIKLDPNRFVPEIFNGEWANPKVHPNSGQLKLLKIQPDCDGFLRIIARQDKKLFAYPWL